jgi:hypothetical protein
VIALFALLAVVPDPAWHAASVPAAHADVGTVAFNGFLYVAGGYDGAGGTANTYFAPLGADGSIGAFSTTTALPNATGAIGLAAIDSRLYVAGGNIDVVSFAPINAGGTLGAFIATNGLTRAPYGQGLVASGGFLYAVGGAHLDGAQNVTYFSDTSIGAINASDGTVTWSSGVALPSSRAYHAVASDGSHLYVAGGLDAGGPISEVLVSLSGNGSTTVPWNVTTALPTARLGATAFTSGGFLFVVGGQDSTLNVLDDVLQARINSDGSLGAWIKTTPFPHARYLHGGAASNGYGYVVNGFGADYTADAEWKALATPGPYTALTLDGLPASIHLGDCVGPLTAQLRDSGSAPTWADHDLPLTFVTDDTGVVHSNPECTSPLTQPKIAAAADSLRFWVRAQQAPTLVLHVSTLDNISDEFSVDVAESADPHTVNGWGCRSGSPAGFLALLLLLAYSSRRATAGSRRDARHAG